MTVDTEKYLDFVHGVTSEPSKDFAQLLARMTELETVSDADLPHLLTAALGLTAESGEFTEVVKKIILQGKPYNEENVFHLKRELGDICWYIAQACMALDTTFDEIIEMNVEKLKARYPGGEFTEVVKKIILQGKPYNEENVFHLKRELGDICWYIAQACMALDTSFDEIIEMNVDKLKARYPGGEFDVHKSENRKEGDL